MKAAAHCTWVAQALWNHVDAAFFQGIDQWMEIFFIPPKLPKKSGVRDCAHARFAAKKEST
jgi:hypothetical protein